MNITKYIPLFILIATLTSCSSKTSSVAKSAENPFEEFCTCFEKTDTQLSFDERSAMCNPLGNNTALEDELTFYTIQHCSTFFNALVALQKQSMKQVANRDLQSSDQAWVRIAESILQDKFETTIELCQSYISLHPKNSNVRFILGYAFEEVGDYDKAIAVYKEMIELLQMDQMEVSIAIARQKKKDSLL